MTSQPAPVSTGTDRLLRIEEVISIVGIGRSTIYDAMRRNDFPPVVRLSRRCSRWSESAIRAWVANRVERVGQETTL